MEDIDTVLKRLGCPANRCGYKYLVSAICAARGGRLRLERDVYPTVAKEFCTSVKCVEKAIRMVIDTAWLRGDTEFQNALFGYTVSYEKGRPTNGEFIATVVGYIEKQ